MDSVCSIKSSTMKAMHSPFYSNESSAMKAMWIPFYRNGSSIMKATLSPVNSNGEKSIKVIEEELAIREKLTRLIMQIHQENKENSRVSQCVSYFHLDMLIRQ